MDRFVNAQNLSRLRRLASETTSEAEKLKLLALLAEEEAKFIKLERTRIADKGQGPRSG